MSMNKLHDVKKELEKEGFATLYFNDVINATYRLTKERNDKKVEEALNE